MVGSTEGVIDSEKVQVYARNVTSPLWNSGLWRLTWVHKEFTYRRGTQHWRRNWTIRLQQTRISWKSLILALHCQIIIYVLWQKDFISLGTYGSKIKKQQKTKQNKIKQTKKTWREKNKKTKLKKLSKPNLFKCCMNSRDLCTWMQDSYIIKL